MTTTDLHALQWVRWQGQDAQVLNLLPDPTLVQIELEDGSIEDVPISEVEVQSAQISPVPELEFLEEEELSVPVRKGATMHGMKVVMVANNAGGVGKTSLAMNIGYELGQAGYRVLLIDADRQANLTTWLGVDPASVREADTLHAVVVTESAPLPEPRHVHGIDLIPAFWNLQETEAMAKSRPVRCIADRIDSVRGRWDVVIFDSAPALGEIAKRAAVASDFLLVPLTTNIKGVEALSGVRKFVTEDVQPYNPGLRYGLFVPTKYDSRRGTDRSALSFIQEELQGEPLASPLPQRETGWELAARECKPVTLAAPHMPVAEDVRRVTQEFMAAIGLEPVFRTGTENAEAAQ